MLTDKSSSTDFEFIGVHFHRMYLFVMESQEFGYKAITSCAEKIKKVLYFQIIAGFSLSANN